MAGMYDASQTKMLWSMPSQIVYEKKHDSALRDTAIRILKNKISKNRVEVTEDYNQDESLILKHIGENNITSYRTDSSCYSGLLSSIILDSHHGVLYINRRCPDVRRIYNLAKKNIQVQHAWNLSNVDIPEYKASSYSLHHKHQKTEPDITISNLFAIAHEFKLIVDKLGQVRKRFEKSVDLEDRLEELSRCSTGFIDHLKLHIKWSCNFVIIETKNGDKYLLPSTYLLMIHNKLCDLISVLVMAQYQAGVNLEKDALEKTISFVQELCLLNMRFGNEFANIAGSIEGLVIAEHLLQVEEWVNDDLFENICEDLLQVEFNYKSSALRRIIQGCQVPLRNELGCLSKIVGHPFVDIEGGAVKLFRRTTTPKELSYEAMVWVVNKAKETFVKNYFYRYRRWPLAQVNFRIAGKDPLEYAMLRNMDPSHPDVVKQCGEISIDDWSRLDLLPVEQFHNLENIIPYLKDKSVSVLRDQAVGAYIEHNKKAYRWEETRLLLHYLMNPIKNLDHQNYIQEYTNCPDLDLLNDYLVIRLVPKEKEEKIKFRGFGVKSYMDRMRSLTQEKNVAHFLSLYCDEQAMTLGELDISKRLYAIRNIGKAYKNHKILNINFDSSGWNNCFRDESVKPVMRETLSRIYGNGVMERIHEAYEKSLFIVPDGDNTYYWYGQQGGIDGLNQYAWVWVYINQIKYAMKDIPITYHIFCKGDDMRIAVAISPKMLERQSIKEWHAMIVNRVSETAKYFGHEIKIQESYGSEKYFTFSKNASIGPIEIPQSFRKIQKVYGANNAILTTLDEYVGSSFSNAHSACRVTTNTYSCYFTALFWANYYILLDKRYKACVDDSLVALLTIPNVLGGLPVIYLHNMFVRAESDLLSPFIDMVYFTENHFKAIHQYQVAFLNVNLRRSKDKTGLLTDPYSLNIVTPTRPLSFLRSRMIPALRRNTKNEDIKELLIASRSKDMEIITLCLSSAAPHDAKVLAAIYAATPAGILGELLRKFETGRSVMDLLLLRRSRHSVEKIFKNVLLIDQKQQEWRIRRCNQGYTGGVNYWKMYYGCCSTEVAQKYRNEAWGVPVTGISMPCMVHQIRITTPALSLGDRHASNNHFLYHMETPDHRLYDGASPHWTAGSSTPFLGYTTRTGNTAPSVSFQEKDPLVIKVKNMLDLYSWVIREYVTPDGTVITSNLTELLDKIIEVYTPITREELAPFSARRKSGTIQHHARAPRFRESIVPNQLSNMYHNVVGNSDSHIVLRNSDMHFTVNFLHILCFVIHMMHIQLEVSDELACIHEVWAVTTPCNYCSAPIDEIPTVLDQGLLDAVYSASLNACRVDHISKDLILRSYNDFANRDFRPASSDVALELEDAKIVVCHEFVNQYVKTHAQIADRFTSHALSTEARSIFVNLSMPTTSRVIGYTEIKKLDISSIISGLVPTVADFILNSFSNFAKEHLLASLYEIPSSELPWTGLLQILLNCGKLGFLLRAVCKKADVSYVPAYENANSSAPIIGYGIWHLLISGKIRLSLSLMSFKDLKETELSIKQIFEPFRILVLTRSSLNLYRMWCRGGDEGLGRMIARQALYVCSLVPLGEALVHAFQNNYSFNSGFEFGLLEYSELDGDCLRSTLEDENTPNHRVYQWIKRKMPRLDWKSVEDEINDEDDVDDALIDNVRTDEALFMVRVVITDLATAISTLRLEGDVCFEDVSSSDDGGDRFKRLERDRPLNFICNIGSNKRDGASVIPDAKINDTYGLEEISDVNFTTNKIYMDPCFGYRLYGSGTTSVNKLEHCFKILRADAALPIGSSVTCLADGYGGFANYFACWGENITITYNSFLTRVGANYKPYDALEAIHIGNNTLSTVSLDAGYHDLTTSECILSLIEESPHNTVVTCDADVAWDNLSVYNRLLINVVRYYLATGEPSSLLICKANLANSAALYGCLALLKESCGGVCIIRCPHSNSGGEIYICASGIERNIPYMEKYALPVLHDTAVAYVKRLTEHLKHQHENIVAHVRDVPITHPRQALTSHSLFRLEASIDSKMLTKCHVPIKLADVLAGTYGSAMNFQDFLLIYSSQVNREKIAKAEQRKKNLSIVNSRAVHAHINTQTHEIWNDMTYLTLCGFLVVIQHVLSGRRAMSKMELRHYYANSLDSIQGRSEVVPATSDHYKRSFNIRNLKNFSPYGWFMEGIHLGMMVVSWGCVLHRRIGKPIHNDERWYVENADDGEE